MSGFRIRSGVSRRLVHIGLVVATAVSASAALGSPATAAPALAASAPAAASPTSPAEKSAVARAAETGHPVEVADQTTETRRVVANPDTTFTMSSSVHPVRVRRDGGWVPVDPTLKPAADGMLRPAAVSADLRFSNGGSGPLVSLTSGDKSIAFSWPDTLPAPVLSGATATYPAVLPGVDLQLTAQADSYSEVLIVHDAAAAANPALGRLKLTVTGTGLALTNDDGRLSAKDASGTEVFHGAAPVMWDSAHDVKTGVPSATDPAEGHLSPLALTLGGSAPATAKKAAADLGAGTTASLTLVPPAGALTGPGVTYPLYLDPSMSGGTQAWLVVSNGSTSEQEFNNGGFPQQVGYCGDTAHCSGIGTARSYFQMDSGPLQQRNGRVATIFSSSFYANEVHQYQGCTDEPVQLHEAGVINSGTRWPGPLGGVIDTQYSHAGDGCGGAANVVFNSITAARDAANGSWPNTTLALTAVNEGDGAQWKKFATGASFDVTFSFPPNDANDLHVSHEVVCGGKVYTPDAFPTLYATATDNNNPPLNVGLWYQLWDSTGATWKAGNGTAVGSASGARAGWQEGADLGNSDNAFRVTVENSFPGDSSKNTWSPGWSPWYQFSAISTPITQVPSISSFDYPSGNWGAPQGVGGKITVNAAGTPYVAGFSYTFAGAGTETLPHTADCNYDQTFTNGGWVSTADGKASITVPAGLSPGYHTMYVRTFDKAHNMSPESAPYAFYVSPNVGVTTTHLEGENTGAITPAQPNGQNVGLGAQPGGSNWPWSGQQQLWFQGSAAGQSFSMAFTTPIEADYALGANLTKSWDYGKLLIALDGKPLLGTDTTPWDGYDATGATAYLAFGGLHLTKGAHTYKITVVATNPASTGSRYMAGVDYLAVTPINNVTAASFTDAMNNHGIGTDNSTVGSVDFGSKGFSAQSLAAAGLAPGSTLTYGGARFTMPAANAATGNDNVVAAGQTIPLPAAQQVMATGVGLLAAATCGASPATTMSITYTDGTRSDATLATVPDWIDGGPGQAPAAILSHWNTGTSPGTYHPKLYAMFVPADPTKQVASVSLPNMGTTFLPDTCARALHVMAIAPRPVDAGWLGAWAAPTDNAAAQPPGTAGLANQTLRIVAHPAISGANARIRLSNNGVETPTTLDDVTFAAQSGTAAATAGAPVQLTFCASAGLAAGCGRHSITLPAGGDGYSDPVAVPATPTGNLVVSLHLPTAVTRTAAHRSANNSSYLASGDATANTDGAPFTTTLASSYYVTAIDVSTTDPAQGTVAVLGDQTSAAGSPGGTWLDKLPAKLAAGGTPLPGGLVNASLTGTGPTGQWKLGEGTGATAVDSAGNHNGTLGGGVSWSAEHGGSAVFDGASGMVSTSGPVLNTAKNYSVSAWVKLSSTSTFETVMSQTGTAMGGFYLQYSAVLKSWTFLTPQTDSSTAPQTAVHAAGPPDLNTWTHLAGTFDVTSGNLSLYVNGALAGTVRSPVVPWNATGPLTIGGVVQLNGSANNYFTGAISDARVFQKALDPDDVAQLYNSGPGVGPQARPGGLSAGNATATLDQTVRSTPNLRTVVLALGTNDILDGANVTSIEQKLTSLMSCLSPTGLKCLRRADGSLVHVVLTTVPPLGLAASDQREKNRQQLNADLVARFNDYGADDIVDFDKAVRDSGNITTIAPGYLTGTTPNDGYYDKLAQTLADAVNTFPPGAQL
ncbi:SGNH hydrolase containing a LamG-like domain [Amycolatopsis mediterranei S699]|uniref:SGNH hydrolase containing a LamG-like domain n=2 Tax=Amycolatopsis mediterranei TaxID=33910 RepID=A0A0H3DHD9_AMYMU|nr:LamG-like jellyroll fold domain-containing protein [Amycolatopsis mediterranei]ADJ49064.1 SGNH hydrolase containing a LamG-like domain [Amycolatopsis mediterranei U32]AEK46023.1 SGNH hydrolase containing a LamG-like domain [Amycolatopsis mediterranei S699]AFO80772.1 SGNH hydrolase containing a LamG-like domain [Amycolatopsis mediterranei S699]AGT87900.1 SGNH hydrolase containing a LamG-like domain [Amycolatopsis mediterranei RB]KDO04043.1 SGNH hydrolase [Amycolatopsis mediterranei]